MNHRSSAAAILRLASTGWLLASIVPCASAWAFQEPPREALGKAVEEVEDEVAGVMVPGQGLNLVEMVRVATDFLRPPLRAELRLLTTAARPSPDQRRAIALDACRCIHDLATRLVKERLAQANNPQPPQAAPAPGDNPIRLLRRSIAASARKHLKPEQLARYDAEVEARSVDHRRAYVASVVCNLDHLLSLSSEQRGRLTDSMLAGWDDRLFPTSEMFGLFGDDEIPELPDGMIVPTLSLAQLQAWRGVEKTGVADNPLDLDMIEAMAGDVGDDDDEDDDEHDEADEDPDEKAAFALIKKEEKKK